MEKIISLLWLESEQDVAELKQQVFAAAPEWQQQGLQRIRFNLVDDDVKAADDLRISCQALPPVAMLSYWLDSAQQRQPLEQRLSQWCHSLASYLVTESEPLLNTEFPTPIGQRSEGMTQVALLQKPAALSREEWLQIWLESHGPLAIEIQSTFAYRQNIVQRRLTTAGPEIDAIVEESFPAAAMADRCAFYQTDGDEALMQARQQQMIESCARFIEFDKMDCLPMSEYYLSDS